MRRLAAAVGAISQPVRVIRSGLFVHDDEDRLVAVTQNVTVTEGALRFASPWKTASMLLPSGSRTKAA